MTMRFSRTPRAAIGWLARPLTLSALAAGAAAVATLTLGAPRLHAAWTAVQAAQQAPQAPQLTEQQKAEFIRSYEALPKVNVPIDAGTAKVLVVKFNDYQC